MADDEIIVTETTSEPAPKKAAPKKKAPAPAPVEEVEVAEEPITVSPATIRARVKGTWRMSFNGQPWDFVDGQHYDLPPDLYRYLRGHENIYDTL